MKMNNFGIDKLVEMEGSKNKMYKDSAGLPTIGVGHLLTQSERSSGKIVIDGVAISWANGLTNDQVAALLMQDIPKYEEPVNKAVAVPLTQNQFNALVCFTFNVGKGAFLGSTLLKVLNNKEYDKVPEQMRRWHHCAGEDSPGLKNRREKEIAIWNTP